MFSSPRLCFVLRRKGFAYPALFPRYTEVMEDEKSESEEEMAALMPEEPETRSPEEAGGGLADIDDSDDEPAPVEPEEPEASESEEEPAQEEKFVDEPEAEAPAADSDDEPVAPADDSEPEELPNQEESEGAEEGGGEGTSTI